jgi:elongation factor P
MAFVKAGNIKKGSYISFRGKPMLVTKAEFSFPGKGSAFMKVTLRGVEDGSSQQFTYKSAENVEELEFSSIEMQYLYHDQSDVMFMSPRTYEQVSIPMTLIEDKVGYLTPDVKVYVLFFEEKAMGVTLPPKVKLKVIDAPDATAGNRAKAAKKDVTLETGLVVMAPLFIKEGEILIIDTETGQYVSRG